MTEEALQELVSRCRKADVKQYEIAREMGVTPAAVSNWEKGVKPLPEDFEERYQSAMLAVTARKAKVAAG